jgi:hypothetical protein
VIQWSELTLAGWDYLAEVLEALTLGTLVGVEAPIRH